ncbi:hypothetical protein AJ87_45250 [Rhizobium yanglingense]|nr:hypothetical protein AJ87_45250 [Rhizobium yanglingense]
MTTFLVFLLAQRRQFSPVAVIVSGLVVSLTCGSASALLMAINREYTEELFIWQSGSLIQNGDAVIRALLPQITVCMSLHSCSCGPCGCWKRVTKVPVALA